MNNQRGYVSATTGQNLVIKKKEFGEHFLVMLFPTSRNDEADGRKISPEYATKSKAEAFAMDWMDKHSTGFE